MLKKIILRIKTDGLGGTLKEFVYINRVMIGIEKDIVAQPRIMPQTMHTIILDKSNYQQFRKKYDIGNVIYYCKNGAQCLLLFENETLLGYQLWTFDNNFTDLKKLHITMNSNEAYLFDLFIYPQFRGTTVPKIIATETYNYLVVSQGITKIYGFYFKDNLKALWWHRAYLKCREIKRVSTNRFILFDITKGRITRTV